jgi:hypothetical protein
MSAPPILARLAGEDVRYNFLVIFRRLFAMLLFGYARIFSGFDKVLAHGVANQSGQFVNIEFGHYVGAVADYGFERNTQFLSNRFARIALGNEREDLQLAGGEFIHVGLVFPLRQEQPRRGG